MITVPFITYPHFTQVVSIDNSLYTFEFNWNARGQYWSMTILDSNKNYIIKGIKIIANYDLVGRYAKITLPTGKFFTISNVGSIEKPAYSDIGNVSNIVYMTKAEYAAI